MHRDTTEGCTYIHFKEPDCQEPASVMHDREPAHASLFPILAIASSLLAYSGWLSSSHMLLRTWLESRAWLDSGATCLSSSILFAIFLLNVSANNRANLHQLHCAFVRYIPIIDMYTNRLCGQLGTGGLKKLF